MPTKPAKAFTPGQEKILHTVMKPLSKGTVWLYRLSRGRLGGRWLRGAPVMLLTTIGRKSGEPRTVPVLYLRDGDRVIVVASKAGVSRHPLWYGNLEANPEAKIEIRGEEMPMIARRASSEEKSALWPRLTQMYRDFDDYQARTQRDIPVVILTPR
jgi:deazaflavin-dependent oxidoreductase (nitroreductase family)